MRLDPRRLDLSRLDLSRLDLWRLDLRRLLERRALPPLLLSLPGAAQRRRLLLASLLAGSAWWLRPWPPLQWLPGWCVGLLLLWALVEWLVWLWSPQRSA